MKVTNKLIWLVVISVMLSAVNLTGCANLRKKFIRKKKVQDTEPKYRRVKEYDVAPSIELYTKHYVYWRSWHRELIEVLGQNSKKDKRCIREMIGNLEDMRAMLVDEKGDELERHIDRLRGIEQDMKKEDLTDATKVRVERILDKELKLIKINFSYRKMEPYIRSDFRRRVGAE